ncbi:MAG: hypothetical protein ABW124_16410 [Candidatus Thiodiazotropha sp. 6PLUC9]
MLKPRAFIAIPSATKPNERMALASKNSRIGDMLLLAEEAPASPFKAEAYITAGTALRKAGQFNFALEQLEKGLAITPSDLQGLREKSVCMQALAMAGNPENRLQSKQHHIQNTLDPTASPEQWRPRKVILFSGHMVDTPGRETPRFPPEKREVAAQRISKELERLDVGADDLALTQGACGGDILFTEACLQRHVKVHWLQPYDEPDFIQRSVLPGGEVWRNRYQKIKPQLAAPILSAPATLGEPPKHSGHGYAYVRCNLWLLYTALAYGVDRVVFLCLWDGEGGSSPGGTAHMYEEVNQRTGKVIRIDSHSL